jgi:hypothetical protein
MAVELVSDEAHVATGERWRHWFDDRSWDRILELARAYGWKGATIEPGDYVNEEAAASLAAALEQALPDIPDDDAVEGRTEWIGDYHLPTPDVTPTEWFSGVLALSPSHCSKVAALCPDQFRLRFSGEAPDDG